MRRKAAVDVQQVVGSAVAGHLIQVRNAGAVQLTSSPVVRSAYLEQVRRIAPPDLWDRDKELKVLANFCVGAGKDQYMMWLAPAWAGKSALMSWFVLHPPPGVQVLSFFITARYKGQDDSIAFADCVMEQLADFLSQPIPAYLTENTREPHLLRMFTQAANMCERIGRKLILIVDGLDEDRGVTTGPDAYSIAALLPAQPPPAMRIILSGRPNPPIPQDVPDSHPLRLAAIRARPLSASAHAEVIRSDMQRELKRLLHGTPMEIDLLGLITAAGGGLSAPDLAQLTGWPLGHVQDCLDTVAGRTFTARERRWNSTDTKPVYVLGHEELQKAASRYFGQAGLAEYRKRLHSWADGYNSKGWPIDTPEYLLRGYFRLLRAYNEISRVIDYVVNDARHDRMLDISGGDSAALGEIRDAREMLLAADEPDLTSIARLALHYMRIVKRNMFIPVGLPAVVAKLGSWERAEELARSITDFDMRAKALAGLAKVAAASGDVGRAQALASRAEALAITIADSHSRSVAMVATVEATAAAGDVDRAIAMAGAISNSYWQSIAVAAVARAAAEAGYKASAEAVANSISNPFEEVLASSIAAIEESTSVLVRAPSMRRGYSAFDRVFGGSGHHARTFAELARAAAAAGDITRTRQMAEEMDAVSKGQPDNVALAIAAEALAYIGDQFGSAELARRAETALDAAICPDKVMLLAQLARAAVSVGDRARAAQFTHRAAAAAQEKIGSTLQADGSYIEKLRLIHQAAELTIAAEISADLSEVQLGRILAQKTEAFARFSATASDDPSDLARLASALDGIDSRRAAEVLDLAEAVARVYEPEYRTRELSAVAQAAASLGNLERVETIASEFKFPSLMLCEAAMAAAAAGRQTIAQALISRAAAYIEQIDKPDSAYAFFVLTKAIADAGARERIGTLFARCESAAASIAEPDSRAFGLADLSKLAVELGDLPRARDLAWAARESAAAIGEQSRRAELLGVAARAAAAAGDVDRAYVIAVGIKVDSPYLDKESESYHRGQALESVASAAAKNGDMDRAREIALEIADLKDRIRAVAHAAEVGATNGGDLKRAKDMAAEAQMMAQEIISAEHEIAGLTPDEWPFDLMGKTPSARGGVLAVVSGALSATGSSTAAETLASAIVDPFQMVRALVAVSKYAEPKQARRILARALSSGYWEICLEQLRHVEPAAVAAIADQLLAQQRTIEQRPPGAWG
jgi:hypothetical protein